MSLSDHYPAMSTDSCDYIGMSGRCNSMECSKYQNGRCPEPDLIAESIKDEVALNEHYEFYGYPE